MNGIEYEPACEASNEPKFMELSPEHENEKIQSFGKPVVSTDWVIDPQRESEEALNDGYVTVRDD